MRFGTGFIADIDCIDVGRARKYRVAVSSRVRAIMAIEHFMGWDRGLLLERMGAVAQFLGDSSDSLDALLTNGQGQWWAINVTPIRMEIE